MIIKGQDFNNAGQVIASNHQTAWTELESVLRGMPLHLKASDQANIQGRAIFDPVGTNEYIAAQLAAAGGWHSKVPIPQSYDFLGTDIDFWKNGALVEVQFSNYPFLLNNIIRSELFFRSQTGFHGAQTGVLVMVTKAGMFPSSNSTLYYEQAVNQLTELATHGVFTVPVRLVGLFEPVGQPITANWTVYSSARYSRTVSTRTSSQFIANAGRAGRCRIEPYP